MGMPFTILNVSMSGTAIAFPYVVAGGSGGTPGLTTFTVVGGTGTAATVSGTINSSGVLTGAITVVSGGNYTAFPAIPAAITGGGLAGATIYFAAGSIFKFDTTLQAIPTYQTQATVTGAAATSPVFTVTTGTAPANGTPVLLQGTGTLTGFTPISTIYFSRDLSGSTFNLSATPTGAAIVSGGTTQTGITAIINPLHFNPHPCPRLTADNNTGNYSIVDHNGAFNEPIFSRWKRSFAGRLSGVAAGSQPNYEFSGRVWGRLVQLTVNVIKAGTAGTATIQCPGFVQNPALTSSPFSQVINLAVAGIRTVTATAVTGAQTGDTIVAYADWLSGGVGYASRTGYNNNFQVIIAGGPVPLASNAVFSVEVLTDQTETRSATMFFNDSGLTNALTMSTIVDSAIVYYYPVNP